MRLAGGWLAKRGKLRNVAAAPAAAKK